MKNKNKKDKLTIHDVVVKRILPLLAIPFILSGCSQKKSECPVEGDHAHLYIAQTKYGTVKTYLNSENLKRGAYDWQNETITIETDDPEFYKVKGDLFDGRENWDYLFNYMKEHQDFIRYHYHYTAVESQYVFVYTLGKYGFANVEVPKEDWTTNKNVRGLDGIIQVCHHKYYGYKIEYKDGKYVKIQSPLVDDIREIIDEYPYFEFEPSKVYGQEHDLLKDVLDNIDANYYNDFQGPDLSTSEMHPQKD